MLHYKYSTNHEKDFKYEIEYYEALITKDEFIQLALEVGSKLEVFKLAEDLSDSFYLNLFHLNAFEQPETVAVYLIDDETIKTESPDIQEIHQQLQQEPNLSDYLVTVDEVEVILNLTK